MRGNPGAAWRGLGGEEGYTLTEMLVVIGIISLIAAVVTPGIMGQLARAKAKTAQMQLETVAASVESFHEDVGRYPSKAEGLKALVTPPADLEGWTGPYIKGAKVLKDPWGRDLVYAVDADGAFEVKSQGADGKDGGEGVNRDLKAPSS